MDTTVNNYPERFLTYLEVEKNCSQHTIESYQKDLAAFAEFMLRRNKQNFFWQQTDPLDVRGYLAELNEKQYARRTIARRYLHCVPFLNTLCVKRLLNIVR